MIAIYAHLFILNTILVNTKTIFLSIEFVYLMFVGCDIRLPVKRFAWMTTIQS
jgi:hypothetical protein